MAVDEDATRLLHETIPYARVLGIEVLEAAATRVLARALWREDNVTAGGALHGGYVMAVADSVGAASAFLNLPEGSAGTTTIESKTNMMGAVRKGYVYFSAAVLHAGRTTIVVETDVTDERGQRVAKTTQTQLVLRPDSSTPG